MAKEYKNVQEKMARHVAVHKLLLVMIAIKNNPDLLLIRLPQRAKTTKITGLVYRTDRKGVKCIMDLGPQPNRKEFEKHLAGVGIPTWQ